MCDVFLYCKRANKRVGYFSQLMQLISCGILFCALSHFDDNKLLFLFHPSGITGYYPGRLKRDFMIWGAYMFTLLRVLITIRIEL